MINQSTKQSIHPKNMVSASGRLSGSSKLEDISHTSILHFDSTLFHAIVELHDSSNLSEFCNFPE